MNFYTPSRNEAAIDPPDEPLICECRPCPKCEEWDNPGCVPLEIKHYPGSADRGPDCGAYEVISWRKCPGCDGRGQYTGDCEIPGHDREPGWEAAQSFEMSPLDVMQAESDLERDRR
jgi:hypothetical protein